jgi:Spy/CpxP family protein refolding chaperone
MKLSKSLLALVASAMVAGMVYAEEKPASTDKPAKEAKEAKPAKAPRLVQPYSLIETSLTPEQKEQIAKILAEYNAKNKEIREKAETDSMAVLTDAQKTELKAAQEKKMTEAKAAKGGADKPTKNADAAKPMEEKK